MSKKEYIKLFSHTIKGKIKNKQVFGIHFFDPLSMRIKEMINNDNKNGVWEAIIEVYDKEREQWYSKKTTSTFFPRDWPLDRLFQECDFAFENKTKDINSNSRFISKTLSGIDVVIIIENDIVKSIYPVNNDREDCLGHI